MWLMLSDAFFSIVKKDCARDELLVRARRRGDIEKVWPEAKVTEYDRSDYLFRARIKTKDVVHALIGEVYRVNYDNFKSSVQDDELHRAYMRVWSAMADVQETPPYGMHRHILDDFSDAVTESNKRQRQQKRKRRGQ